MLDQLAKEVADVSFNCVTVDGDTSTNDYFILIATGQADHAEIADDNAAAYGSLKAALSEVAIQLAQAMARDGEGATKFMTVRIEKGRDRAECKQIAYAIAPDSPWSRPHSLHPTPTSAASSPPSAMPG